MSLDEVRRRLEALNRGPLPESVGAASEMLGAAGGGRVEAPDLRLETLCPGRAVEIEGSSYYAVERMASVCWPPWRRVYDRFRGSWDAEASERRRIGPHPELATALDCGAGGLLFVDLETCGFTGTPVFLIGTMHVVEGDFRVEQLLARTYGQEAGIVSRFGQLLEERPHLVTYNGKSFDWPFLSDRATVSGVRLCAPTGHCDLLHHARRRFRDVLPDCRLQTIEQYECGRRRSGDIPGRDIPSAYHGFVRTGDAREIRDILHHNFLDLVTLAEIFGILASQ